MNSPFKDDDDLEALVRAFEDCTINPAEFKHSQHLAVALWYVADLPFDEASERMCTGIRKWAAAYGKSGYHETITLFWLMTVRDFFAGRTQSDSITRLANQLTVEYDKSFIHDYYSEELLKSDVAKNGWVEPDLKPLTAFAAV